MKEFETKDVWIDESNKGSITLCVRTMDDLIYKFSGISENKLKQVAHQTVVQSHNKFDALDSAFIKTTNVSCAGLVMLSEETLELYNMTLNPLDKVLYRKANQITTPGAIVQSIDLKNQTIMISILDTVEGRAVDQWLGEDVIKFSYNFNKKIFEYEVL